MVILVCTTVRRLMGGGIFITAGIAAGDDAHGAGNALRDQD